MARKLIFLTGGTGFLGHHLLPVLLECGYDLRLLVRPTADIDWLAGKNVEIAYGDVTDAQSVQAGMAGCDYVVHAAGHFRFWGPEETFYQVNEYGTEVVCDAALAQGIERFVHISTIVVVGEPPPGVFIDENASLNPQDSYQKSKVAGEAVVKRKAAEGLPAVILRPGAFYGPYGRYAFNRLFVEEPLRGWRVQVDGGRRYTFPVYAPDVARAAHLAIKFGRVGEIYNICGRSITHLVLNRMVSELLDIDPWRLNVPSQEMILLAWLMEFTARLTQREPFYPINLRHYVFNDWQVRSAKARLELGFEPTELREGLQETIDWYREIFAKGARP
ncbi:MAG: NAD-dependent epimerase/dehydratase family protein [Anaerolineales bacterium]|nr:NAD-dependent epimerase/dehydratase family protein [Anaerolineales bacterium]